MNKKQWLIQGIENNWVSFPVCYWHEMIPLTESEEALLEEDDEICVSVVRIYE
jgi:hypothetical protein